ncbi:MAG: 6,7-dimethyl-8-ribityllumazine synthase [Candidatus Omnitrophica bacterium]|nr:6,7-dimethyl-8-ribityllumazine synthase [Candidatus Omnitrophota bacterium]
MRFPSRYGIVASRFHHEITKNLVTGALDAFRSKGISPKAVDVIWVPGAFELPVAAYAMARRKRYKAVVALGCILQGQTPQYAFISQAAYQGLALASVLSGVPVTSGVITARQWSHARARARLKGLNRGREAALAALKTVQALNS